METLSILCITKVDAVEAFSNFSYNLYKERRNIVKTEETAIHIRKVFGESIGMSICGALDCEIEVLLQMPDSIDSIMKSIQSLTNEKVEIKARKTPYLEPYSFENIPYKNLISSIIKKYTGRGKICRKDLCC